MNGNLKPVRIVRIMTDNDGYVCEHGRLISAPKSKWGTQPLFPLKGQEFVPLEDVKELMLDIIMNVEQLETENAQLKQKWADWQRRLYTKENQS